MLKAVSPPDICAFGDYWHRLRPPLPRLRRAREKPIHLSELVHTPRLQTERRFERIL